MLKKTNLLLLLLLLLLLSSSSLLLLLLLISLHLKQSTIKQIWMIHTFPELHQNVHKPCLHRTARRIEGIWKK